MKIFAKENVTWKSIKISQQIRFKISKLSDLIFLGDFDDIFIKYRDWKMMLL